MQDALDALAAYPLNAFAKPRDSMRVQRPAFKPVRQKLRLREQLRLAASASV